MVRVTDNSGLLAVMMCVKTADMVGNWFVQESIICSKRDPILSYPKSVPSLTVELVPLDMEYSTITSIKYVEIGIRASADVTRGKKGKWRASESAYMAPIFTGLVWEERQAKLCYCESKKPLSFALSLHWVVVFNMCLSERLVRLAQVITQNDRDFMEVILLYLGNCEYFWQAIAGSRQVVILRFGCCTVGAQLLAVKISRIRNITEDIEHCMSLCVHDIWLKLSCGFWYISGFSVVQSTNVEVLRKMFSLTVC